MKHTRLQWTNRTKQTLLTAFFVLIVLSVSTMIPRPAYASLTGPDSGGTGSSTGECQLPDGSQNGVITKYPGNDNSTCCPSGSTDPVSCLYDKYINPAINLLAALVAVIVVISIVWGAMEYVMSGGDPQKAASGRKRITTALVALAAFILLYGFLQFIVPGGFLNG